MTVADRSVQAFLDDVAAGSVTPGGGVAAAVTGAAGAALLEMVCTNTVAGGADEDAAETLTATRRDLAGRRERLLSLADEDAAAVEALMDAYRTPDDEDGGEAIEAAAERATTVPLEIAEACRDVLDRATTVVESGNPNAVADGVIGAHLVRGVLTAMVYTVDVNLGMIDDAAVADELSERADAAARDGEIAFERAMESLPD